MVFPFASCSHIPLEAHEKLMETFLQRKEMVRSRQDKYTKMAYLKFVFTNRHRIKNSIIEEMIENNKTISAA